MKPHTKLPNFFILGAAHAGTASLAHYLGQHPVIWFTTPHDPRFFEKDKMYTRGLEYYVKSLCRGSEDIPARGEASPTYFAKPHLIGPRLRTVYADQPLRFIVLLREPTARAWSHYLYRWYHGYEERDFATALAEEITAPEGEDIYFRGGRYSYLLGEWQHYYPLESFLLLLTEDLAAAPHEQVRRAFSWLNVDPDVQVNVTERLNQASYTQSRSAMRFLDRPPSWVRAVPRGILPHSWLRNDLRRKLRGGFHSTFGKIPELDPNLHRELRLRYQDEVLGVSKLLGRYLTHWLPEDAK